MKGSFNAPFFYAEYTLDLTVKLARFLRRWQLGVACLDTSRLAALAEDKHTPKLNRTDRNNGKRKRNESGVRR